MNNLEKFKKELDNLINRGTRLEISMHEECKTISEAELKRIKDAGIKPLAFNANYQSWYSEAREVIAQLLPNRLSDFTTYYKSSDKRKSVDYENYTVSDYLIGLKTTRGYEVVVDSKAGITKFQQQLLILKSAQKRLESSLFDIKQILQADLFDSELDAAKHLNKNGFTRAAGALAGVVIESHLQQVCESHNIKITKKDPGINDLNQLLKDNDVIDTPQWRKIQHLADLRNLCDHKKSKEPTKDQIDELTDGTDKLIKTLF